MADYYGLLGLDRGASQDEIKKAYRKIARELHPDVNPDPEVQNKFKEVTAAYDVLSDPQKRQQYDMGGQGFGGGFGGGAFGAAFRALSPVAGLGVEVAGGRGLRVCGPGCPVAPGARSGCDAAGAGGVKR